MGGYPRRRFWRRSHKQLNKSSGKALYFTGKLCQHKNCKVTREENPLVFPPGNVFLSAFWVCRKSMLTWKLAAQPFLSAFGERGSVRDKADTSFGKKQYRRGSWAGSNSPRWPASLLAASFSPGVRCLSSWSYLEWRPLNLEPWQTGVGNGCPCTKCLETRKEEWRQRYTFIIILSKLQEIIIEAFFKHINSLVWIEIEIC